MRTRRVDLVVERWLSALFFDGVGFVQRFRGAEALPVDVLDLVAGNAGQPGAERRLALESRKAAQRRKKHLLDHIVDKIGARRQAETDERVNGVEVRGDEPGGRLSIVLEDRFHQFAFAGAGGEWFAAARRLARRIRRPGIHTVIVASAEIFPRRCGR
jgi:hypothetical protein